MTLDDDRQGDAATLDGEPWVQLATRIPRRLRRGLRVYCVGAETSVMRFVVAALREKLQRDGGRRR